MRLGAGKYSSISPWAYYDNKETATMWNLLGANCRRVGSWFLKKLIHQFTLWCGLYRNRMVWVPEPNDVGAILIMDCQFQPCQCNRRHELWNKQRISNDNWEMERHASRNSPQNYTVMLQVASDHMRPLAVKWPERWFWRNIPKTNQFIIWWNVRLILATVPGII